MSYERLVNVIRSSALETVAVAVILTLGFMSIEPVVSRAATDEFTVSQTITGGIAFAVATNDVTMNGSINGLAGGTSYGTTTARVTTNNAAGFNMTISFASTTAMLRNDGETISEIKNYQYSTGTAAYPTGFDTSVAYAQFGFTVSASNTADVSSVFQSSGGTCGSGSFTAFSCWRGASSTNAAATTELINTSSPTAASGATSSVQFRITVPNGPNPSVPSGTYVATATLTATDN